MSLSAAKRGLSPGAGGGGDCCSTRALLCLQDKEVIIRPQSSAASSGQIGGWSESLPESNETGRGELVSMLTSVQEKSDRDKELTLVASHLWRGRIEFTA